MPHYKDKTNKLHFLDDAKDIGLLPAGCVEITKAQADAINTPAPLTTAQKRALITPLSPAQVRLVLNQFGRLEKVEASVALGDKKLKVEWEFRTEFARNNPLVITMALDMGWSDVEVDEMFVIGATL